MATSDYKHKWARYRKEWMSGKYRTLKEMAKKKRISVSTLWKRAAKEGWTEKKQDVEQRTEEVAQEKMIEQGAQRIVSQRIDILEKQIKYTQILIGMSFGTLKGKTKIGKESDALTTIFRSMNAQIQLLNELRRGNAEPGGEIPSEVVGPGVQVNVQVNNNFAKDMTNEQIEIRLKQIAEEKKRLYGNGAEGKK